MAIKSDREYRVVMLPDIQFRTIKRDDEEANDYRVEGYATTFDDPYVLYEFDGVKYMEQIDKNALTGADLSDVIMLYNHTGMVYARLSNGTLTVQPNEKGLYIQADLSSTQESRQMWEAINAGLVTQMSWAFTVEEESYNEKTHTRTILKVRKVYDVSAVSLPANPNTDISARSYWEGVIAEQRRRERERAEKVQRIRIMNANRRSK